MPLEKIGSSKVTRRFQATIPDKVRKLLKVNEGDYLVFLKDKETQNIIIRRAKLVYD